MPSLRKFWGNLWLGIRNLSDELLCLFVTLGAVMFTRLWPGMLALWNSVPLREAPWPLLSTFIPGLFFAFVIVAMDASRGDKAMRNKVKFSRLWSLALQGLGVNSLIDNIQRILSGGGA